MWQRETLFSVVFFTLVYVSYPFKVVEWQWSEGREQKLRSRDGERAIAETIATVPTSSFVSFPFASE